MFSELLKDNDRQAHIFKLKFKISALQSLNSFKQKHLEHVWFGIIDIRDERTRMRNMNDLQTLTLEGSNKQ